MTFTSQDGDSLYEDLYEDLGGGRHVLKTSIQEMEERLELLTKGKKELQSELELMQKKVETTEQEKNVLIRNISCVFKTAQLEIGRKDKQIQSLQEDVLSLKSQTSYLVSANVQPKAFQPHSFSEKQHQKDYNENSYHITQLQENNNNDTVHAEGDKRARQDMREISRSRSSQVKTSQAFCFTEEWQEEGQKGYHKVGCSPTKRNKKDKQDSLDRKDQRYGFEDKRHKASFESRFDGSVHINSHKAPRRHKSETGKL